MTNAIDILMHEIIDYAGLFPPAQLAMEPAVRNYAAYRQGNNAALLGRFVVPVAGLPEFEAAASGLLPRSSDESPWHLSALTGPDLAADLALIETFNARHMPGVDAGAVRIDTLETKATSAAAIRDAARIIPRHIDAYFEIPIEDSPQALLTEIREVGARAKVRTGGIQPELFPSSSALLRFIRTCVELRVPFKATAGLHHVVCGTHALTYAPDSIQGTMFGFLNVFLAAAFLSTGMDEQEAAQVLTESNARSFRFDSDGLSWRAQRLPNETLAHVRQHAAIAFGSCSFEEPVNELKALGLLSGTAS